jgi:hypothetical protein
MNQETLAHRSSERRPQLSVTPAALDAVAVRIGDAGRVISNSSVCRLRGGIAEQVFAAAGFQRGAIESPDGEVVRRFKGEIGRQAFGPVVFGRRIGRLNPDQDACLGAADGEAAILLVDDGEAQGSAGRRVETPGGVSCGWLSGTGRSCVYPHPPIPKRP